MKDLVIVKFNVIMDGKNPPYNTIFDLVKSIAKGQKEVGVEVDEVDSPGGPANERYLHFCNEEKPPMPQPPKQTAPSKILKKLQGK